MDILKEAGGLLAQVAPTIASALGGPFAGQATAFILGALGLSPDATSDAAVAAIKTATPDQLLALKKADNEFAVRMRELEIDLERISSADRASARDMAVKTTIWPQSLLTAFFCLTFGFALSMLLSGLALFPKEYELTVGTLLGALISEMKAASQFWLGSSSGSARKDAMLQASQPPR